MFGFPPVNALTPHLKARPLHIRPHNFNNFGLVDAELVFDNVKRGAVFPRHPDYAVNLCFAEFSFHNYDSLAISAT